MSILPTRSQKATPISASIGHVVASRCRCGPPESPRPMLINRVNQAQRGRGVETLGWNAQTFTSFSSRYQGTRPGGARSRNRARSQPKRGEVVLQPASGADRSAMAPPMVTWPTRADANGLHLAAAAVTNDGLSFSEAFSFHCQGSPALSLGNKSGLEPRASRCIASVACCRCLSRTWP
jgi:hypothetical protein